MKIRTDRKQWYCIDVLNCIDVFKSLNGLINLFTPTHSETILQSKQSG